MLMDLIQDIEMCGILGLMVLVQTIGLVQKKSMLAIIFIKTIKHHNNDALFAL